MQPIQTLPELLSEAGIRLKHWTPGHTEHLDCPKCGGGNHHDRGSLAVTIDPDGDGATWICHRGSCAWTDGIRTGSAARARPSAPAAPRKPVSHSVAAETNRPDWLYQFFAERQIGARTVHAFGCYAVDRRFGDVELPAMVFPYRWHGEVVNRKYRARGEKRGQQQEAGALPTLFNVDRLGDAPAEIVWVEGEPDVMADKAALMDHLQNTVPDNGSAATAPPPDAASAAAAAPPAAPPAAVPAAGPVGS